MADIHPVFTGGIVYMAWYKENVLWKVRISLGLLVRLLKA